MVTAFAKKRINLSETAGLKKMLRSLKLHTVCESALCPNIGECFAKNTATFLVGGDTCTRGCRFCGIPKGQPSPLDAGEPYRIAQAAKSMGIKYAVITSVTRDDLHDGGAGHFAAVIRCLRELTPGTAVEVLTPDFLGQKEPAEEVFRAAPDVFAHNIETVPSLYPAVRKGADYERSLRLLRQAAENGLTVKSGLMLGLGETAQEVELCLKDIRSTGCGIITLGQYLAPAKGRFPVARYVSEDEFGTMKEKALRMGFDACASGVYVRSSYLAEDTLAQTRRFS